jgi:hypothetical protein
MIDKEDIDRSMRMGKEQILAKLREPLLIGT